MKAIWAAVLALFLFAGGSASAFESGHDCAEGNDQDLKWAEQQTTKPLPPTS